MSYLKIITLNCGLLDFDVFGLPIFSNPQYSHKRVHYISNSIRNQNADIIALQECFNIKYTKFIIDQLKDLYPYNVFYNTETLTKLTNGLVFLSKYQIVESQFIEFNVHASLEAIFATKGFLKCCINIPNIGKINFINLHTTSFGDPPEDNDEIMSYNKQVLNEQLKQILNYSCEKTIILGDFNCGPNNSTINYNFLLNTDFIDTIGTLNEFKNLDLYTWSPDSILTKNGPHSHYSRSRIDHIFINKYLFNYAKISNGKIVFTEEIVPINDKQLSTISDHFGIFIELKFDKIT